MRAEFFLALILLTAIALAWVWRPLARVNKIIFVAVALLLPFSAAVMYYHFGTGQQQLQYWTLQREAVLVKQELAQIKNPQQLIDKLVSHLQQHPESAKGWYLLGRLYMGGQQYQSALNAFTKAHTLESEQDDYTVAYAEAAFFAQHNQLTAVQQQLLQKIISTTPNNVPALNLLAVDAYTKKQYSLAVSYWEKLLPLFTPGSSDSKMVLQMIARAQKNIE